MPAGFGTVAVVLGIGWLISMIGESGGAAPGGTEPGGGTGGGGTGGGGGGGLPAKPKAPPAPTGGNVPDDIPRDPDVLRDGGVWGDPSKIPADFDWDGNGWWASSDCTAVAIARGFAAVPYTKLGSGQRQLITTLQSVTTIVPPPVSQTGTLWNYLFHLAFDQGFELPELASPDVLKQISPFCFEVGSWPGGFADALLAEVTVFYEDNIE